MIQADTAYKRNGEQASWLRDDVYVDEIQNGRVSFHDIRGWNYGYPRMGSHYQSTTVALFETNYSEIEWIDN